MMNRNRNTASAYTLLTAAAVTVGLRSLLAATSPTYERRLAEGLQASGGSVLGIEMCTSIFRFFSTASIFGMLAPRVSTGFHEMLFVAIGIAIAAASAALTRALGLARSIPVAERNEAVQYLTTSRFAVLPIVLEHAVFWWLTRYRLRHKHMLLLLCAAILTSILSLGHFAAAAAEPPPPPPPPP